MFFKCKIADKVYQLDKLTLGEARILKRDFGLSDLAYFSSTDPDVIVGLLALVIKRDEPGLTLEQATAQAEALDIDEFDPDPDAETPEPEAEPDPTPEAEAEAKADAAATGKSKKAGK